MDRHSSAPLQMMRGVPQGSVLWPPLFINYINQLDFNIRNASFNLNADDTVIYCSAPKLHQAVSSLQSGFDVVQQRRSCLNLTSNAKKTKVMLFSRSKKQAANLLSVNTL